MGKVFFAFGAGPRIDRGLRRANPHEEQINVPGNPAHFWRYRLHLPLEELVDAVGFNESLWALVASGRGWHVLKSGIQHTIGFHTIMLAAQLYAANIRLLTNSSCSHFKGDKKVVILHQKLRVLAFFMGVVKLKNSF